MPSVPCRRLEIKGARRRGISRIGGVVENPGLIRGFERELINQRQRLAQVQAAGFERGQHFAMDSLVKHAKTLTQTNLEKALKEKGVGIINASPTAWACLLRGAHPLGTQRAKRS
jgi:hypothetical protein